MLSGACGCSCAHGNPNAQRYNNCLRRKSQLSRALRLWLPVANWLNWPYFYIYSLGVWWNCTWLLFLLLRHVVANFFFTLTRHCTFSWTPTATSFYNFPAVVTHLTYSHYYLQVKSVDGTTYIGWIIWGGVLSCLYSHALYLAYFAKDVRFSERSCIDRQTDSAN